MYKNTIKKIIEKTGWKLSRANIRIDPQHKLPVTSEHFFDLYFSMINKDDFFLVQIGANDGKSRDIMHKYIKQYGLHAILVEPQKDIFEKLKDSYKDEKNLKFANVAIGKEDGNLTFYTVRKDLINEKNYFETTAIASLDIETIKKTIAKRIDKIIEPISKDINDYIAKTEVECLTFESFIKKFNVPKFDFLFLDCEGYDFEILKTIDFYKYNPKLINFESKFFSDEDRKDCEEMLILYGYTLFRHGNDTCAFK